MFHIVCVRYLRELAAENSSSPVTRYSVLIGSPADISFLIGGGGRPELASSVSIC